MHVIFYFMYSTIAENLSKFLMERQFGLVMQYAIERRNTRAREFSSRENQMNKLTTVIEIRIGSRFAETLMTDGNGILRNNNGAISTVRDCMII